MQEERPGGAGPHVAEGQRCEAQMCLGRAQSRVAGAPGWAQWLRSPETPLQLRGHDARDTGPPVVETDTT